jgi:exopolysaccharide biosynthesis protein
MLMAGGSIVRYGVNVITTCSGTGEEVRPRTVIGFMPNGDLLVVAMSGRAFVNGVRWGGATNHQAADFMVRLGVKTAVKLDGGTSTTMLVRKTVGGPLLRMDRTAKDFQRATPDSLVFLAPTA